MNIAKDMYESTANALVERMRQLLRDKPETATVDLFDLFKHGLKCDDLAPSLAQAGWAWGRAKRLEGYVK